MALAAARTHIAEHEFNEMHRCVHCGKLAWPKVVEWLRANGKPIPDEGDQRQCVMRLVKPPEMMPEPKRREFACEDSSVIAVRLIELAKERLPVEPEPHQDPGDCCG